MSRIRFTDLTEADFSRLHDWLNRPHLRQFFQKSPISLEGVAAKYGPRLLGDEKRRCHLAWLDAPFGYLQCYRVADFPDWGKLIGETRGIGIDLYIAEPDFIGRGLGKIMLAAYARDVAFPLFPDEATAWIAHETANTAAQACSRSVGFKPVRRFIEDGLPTDLFRLERDL